MSHENFLFVRGIINYPFLEEDLLLIGGGGGVEIGYLHRLIACGVSFQHVRQLRFSGIIKQNLGITRYSFLRKRRFRLPE